MAAALAATLLVGLPVTSVTGAPAALAHAEMERSSPVNGAVLASPPTSIRLTFGEAVELDAAGLVNGSGASVPSQASSASAGAAIVITPSARLAPGAYAATWKATSDDGHVVTGAISFIVGARPRTGAAASVQTTPAVPIRLSGSRPGTLTASIGRPVQFGTLTWTSPQVPGPITWRAGNGTSSQASGVLPVAGPWSVHAELVLAGGGILVVDGKVTLSG